MHQIIDINTLFGSLPTLNADLSLDDLQTLMEKHNVSRACTLSTVGILMDTGVGNAQTRVTCGDEGVLIPVATCNPNSYYGDPTPLTSLRESGFKIVRFFPDLQHWPADYAPFADMLAVLNDCPNPLPVMVDILTHGQMTRLSKVASTYKGTVILAHVTPALLAEAAAVMRHHAGWMIETSYLLAPGSIGYLASVVGDERVVFGSGAPLRSIAGTLQTLQYSGLSDDSLGRIQGGNAARLLSL